MIEGTLQLGPTQALQRHPKLDSTSTVLFIAKSTYLILCSARMNALHRGVSQQSSKSMILGVVIGSPAPPI